MPDLRDQVAIVTGSTKGIGRAIAEALADAGAHVVVSARDARAVEEAAAGVGRRGPGRALGVPCDVRDPAQVRRLVGAAVETFGRLDILVNNAGVGAFAPIDELLPEDWHRVIDTNLTGVYYCCREAVPHMKRQGTGWIVNIGSLAGRYTMATGTAYNASKWGLLGFTEALMLDVRDFGIRVSCVMPGSVDTYFGGTPPSGEAWKLRPEDVAKVVLQLLDHDPRALPSKIELRPARPPTKG
jgi:3-oxoacyl-[acyl-carrier protein] reductase